MVDENNTPQVAPAAKPARVATDSKLIPVPDDESVLPDLPWSMSAKGGLLERYGPEGAEEMYCRVARKYGHFEPSADPSYRPDLAPPA